MASIRNNRNNGASPARKALNQRFNAQDTSSSGLGGDIARGFDVLSEL